MKHIQPPKPLEEMTEEELEKWEELIENLNHSDAWDTLEALRVALNSSHIEAMHHIKKQSRFGPYCHYYLKAKKLFYRDQAAGILALLDQVNKELNELREELIKEGVLSNDRKE